jgi:ferric-dicitrate binding protein FerR (iron transport regulator)
MENRVWLLFSKKLTGEASNAEISELNDLLSSLPSMHNDLHAVESIWNGNRTAGEIISKNDYDRLITKMIQNGLDINEAKPTPAITGHRSAIRRQIAYWATAAAVLIMAIAFWPAKSNTEEMSPVAALPKSPEANQVSTRSGSRSKIQLPDGTQVWLNADSRLTYGNDFGAKTRDVTLSGEAYFDVVPNKAVPFFIHTSKMTIKVTGTAFNVRAYPNEDLSETSLVHGKVEVTLNGQPDKTYYLQPSEKLVIAGASVKQNNPLLNASPKSSAKIPPMAVAHISKMVLDDEMQLPVETAWVNNRLVFVDESFRDLANKMERWYGVTVQFAETALEDIHFTGRFENETIQEALEAMQLTAKFGFQVNGNTITITKTSK